MYPRQSGHYSYVSQQPSQYSGQPPQYYETPTNYYQSAPQQPQPAPPQFAIGQSPVVPQFHVFTQPVTVYAQYPYQQQQQQQPQPQHIQVPTDQIYYTRQTAPTAIVTATPQPPQSKQIAQLNQPPDQLVNQYQLLSPQHAQVSPISTNPTQQLIQQQSAYAQQSLKKKEKSSYPQSSMILTQLQSPSVYQQQQQQPSQIQMQVPIRQATNLQPQQQQMAYKPPQKPGQRNTEMQFSSNLKQQFHFNQDEPPGCFDIIGRGNLPSVIFDSDVTFI